VREAVQESSGLDQLEISGAPDPIGDISESMGASSGIPNMATDSGGFNLRAILLQVAVFIAVLVFGRTVIQELI
jgi:hypothetical protein